MPAWKSLLSVLALASTAVSCAHHGDVDAEVVPEHEREELLKKWDQEVSMHLRSQTHSNSPYLTLSSCYAVVLLRHIQFRPPPPRKMPRRTHRTLRHRHNRRPLRHSRLLPTRRPLRTPRHPRCQRPPNVRHKLQHPRRHKPVQILGQDYGLRRHPHHTL